MRLLRFAVPVLLALFFLTPARADAAVIVSLPDYDGPFNVAGFPIDLGVVDTFVFALPAGAVITGASFSGTYGTQAEPLATAGFNVVIEGAEIVVCAPFSVDCWEPVGDPLRPFSFALPANTFPGLLDGSAGLQVIQTNEAIVRLGAPTLTIDFRTQQVPEPASLALVGLGLVGVSLRRRLGYRSTSR